MERDKKEALEAAGWKCGTVAEFLELTIEEINIIELRLKQTESSEQTSKVLAKGDSKRNLRQ